MDPRGIANFHLSTFNDKEQMNECTFSWKRTNGECVSLALLRGESDVHSKIAC